MKNIKQVMEKMKKKKKKLKILEMNPYVSNGVAQSCLNLK
jgi:hypothetical protein